ncbi:hypothetical protein FRC10_004387 [Ceratobasidium sp. 414]|nr:hypothetical protein FRC10_004387 [Ceratobasidium sp. 414]
MRDKLRCFREREPILCPASPPTPEISLLSEEEFYRKSQERIDTMAQRLSNLPMCQARYMIDLACTQLQGPFKEGCRYWGTGTPVAMSPTDISLNNAGPVPGTSRPIPRARKPSPPPELMDPGLPPLPSLPPVPGPPSTPQAVRSVEVDLVPTRASVGRMLMSTDAEVLLSARSPTPTPARPPPFSQATRYSQAPRQLRATGLSQIASTYPPETPKSQLTQSIPGPPARTLGSAVRCPSQMARGPQIFPRHSTPMRQPGSMGEDEPLTRESSPLLRFSQREPSQVQKATPSHRQLPRFSPSKILSQHESSGDDFFDSQVNLDRQFRDITDFIEGDIAN